MDKLFYEIRTNNHWEPNKTVDYSFVDIEELKKLADKWFDKLIYNGDFFHEYNEVLYRIEKLKNFLLQKSI